MTLCFSADALVRRGMNLVEEYKEVEVCAVPPVSCSLPTCDPLASMVCSRVMGDSLTGLSTVEGPERPVPAENPRDMGGHPGCKAARGRWHCHPPRPRVQVTPCTPWKRRCKGFRDRPKRRSAGWEKCVCLTNEHFRHALCTRSYVQAAAAAQAGASVIQPNVGRIADYFKKNPGAIQNPRVWTQSPGMSTADTARNAFVAHESAE